AVCDRWFSSVPGPTIPNHVFAHYGTSSGRTDMSLFNPRLQIPSIFSRLLHTRHTTKFYAYDELGAPVGTANLLLAEAAMFTQFGECLADGRAGTLPEYSFVEPSHFDQSLAGQGVVASDQHPDHHVAEGERFIANVYNAIRDNDTLWRESLLLITYSTHGGFYD